MPDPDIASQWKSFSPERRDSLLKRMNPGQKKALRARLEAPASAAVAAPSAPEAQKPGVLDYHPPGTEGGTKGDFADTYLRPVGNTARTMMRDFAGIGSAVSEGISNTISSGGGNVIASLKEQAHGLAHPIDAHNKAAQDIQDRGADTSAGTTIVKPGEAAPAVNYDRDLPEVAGHLGTQLAVAELTDGAMKIGGKMARGVTPGALKEKARVAARGILGADKSLTRKVVSEAADKMSESDASVTAVNAEQEQVRTRRREAQKDLDTHTANLKGKTEAIQKRAFGENNERWNSLREKIGDDPVAINPIKHTIENAEAYMSPDEVKQFRQILSTQEPKSAISTEYKDWFAQSRKLGDNYESLSPEMKAHVDGQVEAHHPQAAITDESKPATFSRLQGWYTELGQKMNGGGQLSGNVYKALKDVRNSIGGQAEVVADSKGALGDLKDARKSHQQYHEAFGRQRNVKISAAEQARKEANPQAFAAEQETARRAKVAVHDPTYLQDAQNVDNAHNRLQSFPSEASINNAVQAPKNAPVVDIHKVAKDQIEKRAGQWAQFNKRDIGIISSSIIATPILAALGERSFGVAQMAGVAAYEGGTRALASIALRPGMAEWFAKAPIGELEALEKIPGADRVKIVNGITEVGIQAAKAGKPVAMSSRVASLLGEKNTRLIIDASVARKAGKVIRNPREAREQIQMPTSEE